MFYRCETKENRELPLDSITESGDNLNCAYSVFAAFLPWVWGRPQGNVSAAESGTSLILCSPAGSTVLHLKVEAGFDQQMTCPSILFYFFNTYTDLIELYKYINVELCFRQFDLSNSSVIMTCIFRLQLRCRLTFWCNKKSFFFVFFLCQRDLQKKWEQSKYMLLESIILHEYRSTRPGYWGLKW